MNSTVYCVFIPFRAHFNFYFDIPTFLQASRYPSSHPQGIHPSLLNAIYLVACNLAFGSQNPYDSLFLTRTRAHLDEALSMADRLTHFMWGSLVLCTYLARLGRIMESHSVSATTVSFAVGCGLPERAALEQTGHYVDIQERHLWGALCNMEFAHAWTFDLPCSVPERFVNEMEAHYFNNVLHGVSTLGEKDIVYLLSCTSLMVYLSVRLRDQYDEAARLNNSPSSSLLQRLYNLGDRLDLFRQSLPPIDSPEGLLPGEITSQINHLLVRPHFGVCLAAIQLWNILAPKDDIAYANVVEAALSLARLARIIRLNASGTCLLHVPLNMISHTYTASEVLIRECHRPRWFPGRTPKPGSSTVPSPLMTLPNQPDRRVSDGLNWLFDFQLEMLRHYPLLARSLGKLKDLVDGSEAYDMI
ncbi:uncharacterized protein EI90DRAFT_1760342 [Cantharellus anzutake]|uniref:uncharacterized protein n=1 Tax=Cantharellus anzutake TaxID=1750568 RepID=UPI00190726BE|nr:uncharacterized protein EI90DRAFT_1760342 [Cantharellus anzutake]KAF8341637.1 hypothetical protein EI90DRAFT_1760342 [Cantharellus anzutake]